MGIEIRSVVGSGFEVLPNNWSGKTLLFLGDSLTEGFGASSPVNRWTSLFSQYRLATEDNEGVSYTTGQNDFSDTQVPTKTSSYHKLFIAYGTNDILGVVGGFTPENFELNYVAVLEDIVAKGWSSSDIILLTPFYIGPTALEDNDATIARQEEYVNVIKDLCTSGGYKLADVYQASKDVLTPLDLLTIDEIHPNDLGYEFIFNYIKSLF